jgi:hypothetical protein
VGFDCAFELIIPSQEKEESIVFSLSVTMFIYVVTIAALFTLAIFVARTTSVWLKDAS